MANSGYNGVRNVWIGKRRTSIRLEPEMWDALEEISAGTGRDINEICTEVREATPADQTLTSALRVFILSYFRRPEDDRSGGLDLPSEPVRNSF